MSDATDPYPAAGTKHPSLCSLDELEERYWDDVAPDMRVAGMDPDSDRPTYKWLSANGHRDLLYALKEYHGLSFGDFWTETLGLASGETGYNWSIEHEATIEEAETYIEQKTNWTESTANTHRQRLNRYLEAYYAENGEQDVLERVRPEADVPPRDAVDACWAAFSRLERDPELSDATIERIYRAVNSWYSYLLVRRVIALNPADGLRDVRGWGQDDGSSASPTALSATQVRAIYDAAHSNRGRVLVVALCAWGLRPGEVAALHRDQLHLDAEQPYIEFETRKNGPGTVTVVYGQHDGRVRLSRLRRSEDWNGYLFPSPTSQSGHRTRGTILRWFKELCRDAGIEDVEGESPKAKMGRRFWYNAYSETLGDILEFVGKSAEDQGSSDPRVVMEQYLDDERERELRRQFMRARLDDAFDGAD